VCKSIRPWSWGGLQGNVENVYAQTVVRGGRGGWQCCLKYGLSAKPSVVAAPLTKNYFSVQLLRKACEVESKKIAMILSTGLESVKLDKHGIMRQTTGTELMVSCGENFESAKAGGALGYAALYLLTHHTRGNEVGRSNRTLSVQLPTAATKNWYGTGIKRPPNTSENSVIASSKTNRVYNLFMSGLCLDRPLFTMTPCTIACCKRELKGSKTSISCASSCD